MRFRTKIWIQATVVALILLTGVGAALAWFVNYRNNRMEVPQIQLVTGDYMEISADGRTWDNQLVLNAASLRWDITGDGVSLWRPKMDASGAAPDLSEEANWTAATKEPYEGELLDFIEIPISFRSDRQMKIYLGAGSSVQPVCPEGKVLLAAPDTENWNNVENVSNFSTSAQRFSRNYIAGAVRVAILENKGTEDTPSYERKVLWVPNPGIQLISTPAYRVNPNGQQEESYTYYFYSLEDGGVASKTLTQLTLDQIRTGFTTTDADSPAEADFVTQMEKGTDEMYYANLIVRIWIEGTDRESRLALAGGKFDAQMQFVAVPAGGTASDDGT